jgi:predicted GNAT family acetyltransferase
MADPSPQTPDVVMNEMTHRFEVSFDGETAFSEYRLHPGYITLPHTVVPPAFEGKGVGSALAKAALGYARAHGLMVKPACPFIAGYIGKHREWQDLVHPDFRGRLGLPG